MAGEAHLTKLVKVIDEAVNGLNSSIPSIERQIVDEIVLLLRELELFNGKASAAQMTKNLKVIGRIKSKIDQIILTDQYQRNVSQYLKAYNEVTVLQKEYFKVFEKTLPSASLLSELQSQSVKATISSLTGAGISANIAEPIQELLRQNITTGVQYNDMVKQLRLFIEGNAENVGHLSRYVKGYTTDALNQYAAQYMDIVSNDLGLEWFEYAGIKMATSRKFCIAMVDRRYFHKSEIPDLLKGNFAEFNKVGGTIYKKTGLPDGLHASTNPENFFVFRGGWSCQHQPIPVTEDAVPLKIRLSVYDQYGIKHNEKGYAIAA